MSGTEMQQFRLIFIGTVPGTLSAPWMMQETPRFLMNKKYLTLLAENHRGGSCTRSHGARGNAVLHALRVRRRRWDAGASKTAYPRRAWERGECVASSRFAATARCC